jgi:hypothetical protein
MAHPPALRLERHRRSWSAGGAATQPLSSTCPGIYHLTRSNQRLYVVPRQTVLQRIIVLERNNPRSFWTPEPGLYPTAIDGPQSGDNLCVLYGSDRTISIFSWDHRRIASWSIPELPGSPWRLLEDIAYNASTGQVAITDQSGGRLHLFQLDGTPVGEPRFLNPTGTEWAGTLKIAALRSGEFLVTAWDGEQHHIRRLGSDGEEAGPWGEAFPGLRDNFAIGADGNVYLPASVRTVHKVNCLRGTCDG